MRSHALFSGLRIQCCCGVGHRCGSDPALLWLQCRLAAVALIQPLAWELPYTAGVAIKIKKKEKKRKNISRSNVCHFYFFNFNFFLLRPHVWHMEVPRLGV